MNICFFTDMAGLGGGELWVLRARRILIERGHQVSIVCPYRSGFFRECQKEGADVFAYFRMNGVPFHNPLYYFLRKRQVDVLYCTVIGAFCESRTLEAILDRINEERKDGKAVLVLKTGLPPIPGLSPEYYGLNAGPLVRRLHVVARVIKEDFLAWLPKEREALDLFVQVVPEGIDLTRFSPEARSRQTARERWGVGATDKVVVSAARLHPMKGIDNLLLAAAGVAKACPDFRLLIAGDGDDRARLEQLAAHLELGQRARFLGHIDDVASLLVAGDVFCHPSLADGLPNSVVEAMAMQLPVVASAVGGIPDLVADGVAGALVPPHDIRALENALLDLLQNPDRAAALGEGGRRNVEEIGSLHANTARLEQLLLDECAEFQRDSRTLRAPIAPPAPSPIRVMFLMNALRTGGEETELAILARRLDRSQFALSVLSLWSVNEATPAREQLQRLAVPVDTACHELRSLEEKVGYALHKIREQRIQVVVACQDTLPAYHIFEHLSPDECRLVEHAGIVGEVYRIPKQHTARCVGVSREIARQAASLMPEPSRAVFLPSMVDMTEYDGQDRERLRRDFRFDSDCVVLFVGRLDPKKGIEHLIDAAAELLPNHPHLRFVLVGGPDGHHPEYFSEIHTRARARCGLDRFVFAGPRSDVPGFLAAADMLVLPSRGEGMSHVINEAGAAGLAVIATDDGAAREQLENGEAGVLLPSPDPAHLVRAIESLLLSPERRARFGAELRARVRREYSAHKVVPQWAALLREVAAGMKPVPAAPALRLIPADRLPPFPLEIQIETNTVCNARCIMCPYPEVSKELPHGRMSQELYERILEQCVEERSLWRIEPFLNNEPFTDPRMVDWIALAKKKVPHAMVTITTNGSLVTPKITDRLIHSGLDAIWFSFNGATKETYEQIMGLSFDRVKSNIDYLLDAKPPSLRVFTNMIETVPMKGEIADNIRYWRSRGVESGASPLVNRAGNVRNFAELNYQPVNPKPVRICELLYHKMYIAYNGEVLLCCMDWRRRVSLGNVHNQTLGEIWHGEKYQHYRRLHEEGRPLELELCKDCSYVHT